MLLFLELIHDMRVLFGGGCGHHVTSCLDTSKMLRIVLVIPAFLQEFVVSREDRLIREMHFCYYSGAKYIIQSYSE